MLVPFDQLSVHSRVWIYQANRSFTLAEEEIISSALTDFCSQWVAHGNPLKASFKIELDYFIVLSVDESAAGASGCSIDGSVRVLKELGNQLNVDFFDRTHVAFLIEGEIKLFPIHELSLLFKSATLSASSITFNNLVFDKNDFEKSWKAPAENGWLREYLPKTTLSA